MDEPLRWTIKAQREAVVESETVDLGTFLLRKDLYAV